jgi:hypothetical protein|tara:strand:- start:257 stop:844 length:588 start_codon:yes stop_codon:yes gene_type:complete
MGVQKLSQILLLMLAITLSLLVYNFYIKNNQKAGAEKIIKTINNEAKEEDLKDVINDLKYSSVDIKGNKYQILSKEGVIDLANSNIIYMTKVDAKIELLNEEPIFVTSNFAKYNQNTNDTTFTENVLLLSGLHTINTEELDFSFENSLVNMSNEVVYKSKDTILVGDRLEFDLITKKTKIFMNNKSKKVKIKTIK